MFSLLTLKKSDRFQFWFYSDLSGLHNAGTGIDTGNIICDGKVMDRVLVESEFLPAVVRLVGGAERSVDVCMFEWGWYPGRRDGTVQSLNRALGRVTQRGVRVRLLLHNESVKGVLGKRNRKLAHEMEVMGCKVRLGGTGKVLHAKFWVIDGVTAVVGSHNISQRACKGNAEVSVVVEDAEAVGKLSGYFERLWTTYGR